MTIEPLYLSKEIFGLLSVNSEISLHSIFSSSINFKIGETIVNVSINKYILPPYGIVLREEDFRNMKYEVESDKLQLKIINKKIYINNIKIDLVNATKEYSSAIIKAKNKVNNLNLEKLGHKLLLSGKKNGFNMENDLILNIILNEDGFIQKIQDPLVLEFHSKLKLLSEFFLYGDNEEVLKYFIGRGMGLTPAGDDFLVGILGVLSSYGLFEHNILKVREFIVKNKSIYTNDISEQFLILSAKGRFSINIIALLNMLSNEEFDDKIMDNVLNYGGTSGVDIILGISFAYKAILLNNRREM